jgi:hypothetical protein
LVLDATAVVRLESVDTRQSRVLNASEQGLMLMLPDARPVGTRIHVTLYIGEDPPAKIEITGIIVHVTALEAIGPRQPIRAGIFITESGPDWAELCRTLAAR